MSIPVWHSEGTTEASSNVTHFERLTVTTDGIHSKQLLQVISARYIKLIPSLYIVIFC